MAKDSLSDAIFELKERERKGSAPKQAKRSRPRRKRSGLSKVERPRAFDSFHVFCQILLAMGMALQFAALALYL